MNKEIKSMIRQANLFQWQIAKALGVTAGTLTIWLRDDPMPEERRQRIIEAIGTCSHKLNEGGEK